MFKKGELEYLWPFYAVSFFIGFTDLIGAYFVIYFIDKGFTYTSFSIFWSMLFFMPLLFEIPTGAIADYFGRKLSSIIGLSCMTLLALLVPFTDTFWGYMFLFMLWGAALTMISGAYDAWVIDSLDQAKKRNLTTTYYSKDNLIRSIGQIVAPLIAAALIAAYSMDVLWYGEALGFFIAVVILVFAKEKFKKPKWNLNQAYASMLTNTKKSFSYCRHHPIIFWLIIGTLFFTINSIFLMIAWQPLFLDIGLEKETFGILYSIMAAITAVLGLGTERVLSRFKKVKHFLIATTLIMAITLILFLFTKSMVWSIAIFLALSILSTFKYITRQTFFQAHIPSKQRATIGSVNSLLMGVGMGVTMILGGFLLDRITPQQLLAVSALFLVVALFAYARIRE